MVNMQVGTKDIDHTLYFTVSSCCMSVYPLAIDVDFGSVTSGGWLKHRVCGSNACFPLTVCVCVSAERAVCFYR
jgi:hypothetical protein